MKILKKLNFKKTLLTCLAVFATTLCAAFGVSALKPAEAKADGTLSSTVYQTDGASVRVFKWNGTSYESTDRTGIRFHVEMGANYLIPQTETPLLDVTQTNKNGSYKMAEGYKSYTLILPTRLMGGSNDLTKDLDKVMAIDTTEYWFGDDDGNWESVAYIYNVPQKWYTDEYTYRGIVVKVDGETETPVMWTAMETRSLTWVAKQSYVDTIDTTTDLWGSPEQDDTAAPLIKQFIPTYTINYKDGSPAEEVLWGDKIAGVDTTKTYYDETNHESIDVSKPLNMAESTTITLNSTQVSEFVFTGVEYTAEGFNVFATLPTKYFGHDVSLEPSAIDMVTDAGNVVKATSVVVHVEGAGADAVSEIKIGFSYENISNGTKLTILDTSHFYNNGILYDLSKDYTFEYYNQTWELPLGQITLVDIATIKNYTETGANGVEHNVRITFNKDFLVNGRVEFKNADGEAAEITITCPENNNQVKKTISDGYYYWNQGEEKILEIPGPAGGNFWGEHENDIMTIPAGTRVYQNNGYYLVSETITATFNGGEDWLFAPEYSQIDASHFLSAYTRQDGDSIYIDVMTQGRWATDCIKVVCNDGAITYNHTDNVTKHELTEVFYHGENNNQILRLHIHDFSVTGDWVSIPAGIQFWVGNKVYTLTEEINSYFVDTKQWNKDTQQWDNKGSTWITNPQIKEITQANFTSIGWYQNNIRFNTDEIWSAKANNPVIMDDTYINGGGVETNGTNYNGFYYYGGTNNLLEMQGVNFAETGGSVTLKAGIYFWVFDNTNFGYVSGYRLAEDITIQVSGATGSQMYKDTEVATIKKSDIASFANLYEYVDGNPTHGGEIRITLTSTKVSGMYGAGTVEGSATLNDEATTSAFIYGGDGTSGYSGNTIIAFTGESFGKPFQATNKGDLVTIAEGTKVWLSNGSGYVTIADELVYVYNGSEYKAQTEHNVTINSTVTIKDMDGNEITGPITAKTGERVSFKLEIPEGYKLASVTNATETGTNTYTTDYLFDDVTVTVNCSEPIKISQEDVRTIVNQDGKELRFYFHQTRSDIAAIEGENYNITFNGTIELTLGGVATQPTQYNYFGIIGDNSHQALGIKCDMTKMVAGDHATIKAGSTFKFGSTVLLVESDITAKMVGVTANFDANLSTLSLDGEQLTSGATVAKLAGTASTVVFGWTDVSNSAIYDLSVKINGVEQGSSGEYTVTLDGNVTIDVTLTKKTYTATLSASGASVSGVSNNQTITHGETYNFTVSANSDYQLTSVTINGTEQGTSGSYSFTASGATSIVVTAKKLYAVTWSNPTGATISVTANGNAISSSGATVVEGTTISVTATASGGYRLNTVTIGGANQSGVNTSQAGSSTFNYTVNAATSISATTVKMYTVSWSAGDGTTVTCNTSGLSSGGWVDNGTTVSFTINLKSNYKDLKVNNTAFAGGTYSVTVNGANVEVNATAEKEGSGDCLAAGTMITLENGAKRAVELLNKGDRVMAFDHLTGTIVYSEVIIVVRIPCTYTRNTFVFDDGTELATINEHGIFDLNLNKYVNIDHINAGEYIGHTFVSIDVNGNIGTKKLIDVISVRETGYKYDIVTNQTLNYVAEDTLSVTHVLVDVINSFDFGEDLMYDKAKMQEDIEKYGLYTYDEWAEYCDVSVFEEYNIPVMKVGISKGLYTKEYIIGLINKYVLDENVQIVE